MCARRHVRVAVYFTSSLRAPLLVSMSLKSDMVSACGLCSVRGPPLERLVACAALCRSGGLAECFHTVSPLI